MSVNYCKYYNPHMKTIKEYIHCLYALKGCESGGLLHILLDEDNIDDYNILYCLKECLTKPNREESRLGALICEEYLKLSMKERIVLCNMFYGYEEPICLEYSECNKCPIINLKHELIVG